jgi:hypothetical protein
MRPAHFPHSALSLLLCHWLCFGSCADAQAVTTPETGSSLVNTIRSYEAQEAALDAEIEPQLLRARDKLTDDLLALATKLNAAKKGGEAAAVRKELEHFEKTGVAPIEKPSSGAVRAAAVAYVRAVAAAKESVALKRKSVRTRSMQAMIDAERAARNHNYPPTAQRARLGQQSLTIRNALDDPARLASTQVAGRDHDLVRDIPKQGMPLIGFRGETGGWFQFTVVGSLQSLYLSPAGPVAGNKWGHAGAGREIVARDGYAVGGILVRSGEVIDGLQLIFMRMKPDGLSLDPQDFYVSDWIGKAGNGARELSAKGKLIIGLTGRHGDVVESLGLIYLK